MNANFLDLFDSDWLPGLSLGQKAWSQSADVLTSLTSGPLLSAVPKAPTLITPGRAVLVTKNFTTGIANSENPLFTAGEQTSIQNWLDAVTASTNTKASFLLLEIHAVGAALGKLSYVNEASLDYPVPRIISGNVAPPQPRIVPGPQSKTLSVTSTTAGVIYLITLTGIWIERS